MFLAVVLGTVCAILPSVSGYGTGPDPLACANLDPVGHHQGGPLNAQASASPFSITLNKQTYAANEQIQVTLTGLCDRKFKGFMIQARVAATRNDPSVTEGVGTFISQDPRAQTMCGTPNFAITHNSPVEKDSIVLMWTAPATAVGHIEFVGTFVEAYSVYWHKVTSELVEDTSDASDIPGAASDILDPTDCPLVGGGEKFNKDPACGSSRGCYHDCDNQGCTFLVTWRDEPDHVLFTIKANFPPRGNDAFMALGLSADQRMGSDGVTECVYMGGNMATYNSQNSGRTNARIVNPGAGVSLVSGTYANGVFECSVRQMKQNPSNNEAFDLTKNWYLLLARGITVTPNGITKHIEPPKISSAMANFQQNIEITGASKNSNMIKAHACLMIVAWIFAASIGIIIARYYKTQWPDSTCGCGEKVWFQLHRTFMIITFAACVSAFVIIFVHVGGYSDLGTLSVHRAHPILGIIATALAVINPIMALFRCHPNTPNRPIFNWAHFAVGSVAHILAVVAVFLGVNLTHPMVPEYVRWILVGYVVWQLLVECLLVFCRCADNGKDRQEAYEMTPKGVSPSSSAPNSQTTSLKQGLLLLHIIAITGVTTCLVILILISL